ncbi:MAG: class I SAM-dependent methyltransferase [Pseudomonadota bacterium]
MREFWDSLYTDEAYVYGTEPNAFLLSQRHRLRPGQTVLAMADGEGRNGVWLAEQGLKVHAVDFSPVAQAKARRLAKARGVEIEFEQADLLQWDWGRARYDVVVAIFVQFANSAQQPALFARMREALKPGGILLLQGYRPEQLRYGTGGPSSADNMYTEAILREGFAGFEILHLVAHDSFISEGYKHHGMSALIDLVARKPA